MRKRFTIAITTAALSLAISAAPVLAGKSNDTLVWATDREMDVPLSWYNNTREMVVMSRHIFDTLLYRDTKTFEYLPQLASSYKWVNDVTMDFELRKDVVFHNGKKFNADDVVSTFNHLSSPDSGVLSRREVGWMKTTEKLGEYKVRIHFKKPFPAAMEFLSGGLSILPAGIWKTAKKDVAGKPDYGTVAAIGTGPYKLVEWVPGEKSVLERNDNYFAGPKGKATIKRVIFRTVADPEAQIALSGAARWGVRLPEGISQVKIQKTSLTFLRFFEKIIFSTFFSKMLKHVFNIIFTSFLTFHFFEIFVRLKNQKNRRKIIEKSPKTISESRRKGL